MVNETHGAATPDSSNAGDGGRPVDTVREGRRARTAVYVATAAAAAIVAVFSQHYPLGEWLLWAVLRYWFLASYWAAGCLGLGLWLVAVLCPSTFRFSERLVVGFALGVLGFALITFAVGLAGQLNRVFFVVSPALLGLVGAQQLRRALQAAERIARLATRMRLTPLGALILVFGVAGLVTVYLPILTVHNVQHDARWYHLPIAAQYASSGKIGPFAEGWFLAAYPHLASILYAWALLWPMSIVHRLELCAHVEFLVFLATIAAIPVALRRILPRANDWLSWAAVFLFPGLFVYDSNLSTGADHVAALWAIPGLLAWFATERRPGWGPYALVGAFAAGAALTKYSALDVAIPLLAAAALTVAPWPWRSPAGAGSAARGALVCTAVFAGVTSIHWLKNIVWHGDPLYPMLHDRLHAHPWSPRSTGYFAAFVHDQIHRPEATLSALVDSVLASFTVGFTVRDYPLHGAIPTFGFLFAATFPIAFYLRPPRRLFAVYALGIFGAFVWFWTNQRDRYLQACLPWFVVATATALRLLWNQRHQFARLATSLLVGAQIVCGAGVFFIPAHIMIPEHHPLPYVRKLIASGYEGRYRERFEPYDEWNFRAWVMLGKKLPPHSKVLVHEDRLWLGLDAPVVVDEAAWQAGIDYSTAQTTADIYDILVRFGVTHVVTGHNHPGGGDHGVFGDILFWGFLHSDCTHLANAGSLSLWALPAQRPPAMNRTAAVATCSFGIPPGLYALDAGTAPTLFAPLAEASTEALSRADYVAVEDGCSFQIPQQGAERLVKRDKVDILSRLPQR
jgi:hypothetical protein